MALFTIFLFHGRTIGRHTGLSSVPQLVVAQFQERFYPCARVVPNVVDIPDDAPPMTAEPTTICYSPTVEIAAFASRWWTKGFPETLEIIRGLVAKSDGVELDLIQKRPVSEVLARKARATIGVDEVVTGSYHRNSLEFLALGRPTLCHIDERVAEVLTRLTGCSELPWVQTTLGQLGDRLGELVRDLAATSELGERSHAWMKRYWHPSWAATCYERCYQDLLEGRPWSEPRFDLGNRKVWFSVIGAHDEKWRLRRNAWSGEEAAPPSDIGGSSFAEWIAVSGYWRSDVPMSVSLDGVPCRVAGLRQRHIEDDGLLLLPYQDGVPGARLNRTARIIWEQCDGRTSVRTITASLAEMLDCGAERIAQDVSTAIQHLLEAKVVSLLDGPLPFLDGNPFRP